MSRVAQLAVAAAVYAIDRPYSYRVPEDMPLAAGMRVLVPFGHGNRRTEGIVLSVQEGVAAGLKAVEQMLDDASILTGGQLRLAAFMKERYFCTFYEAVKAILPAGLWFDEKRTLMLVSGAQDKLPPGMANSGAARLVQLLTDLGGSGRSGSSLNRRRRSTPLCRRCASVGCCAQTLRSRRRPARRPSRSLHLLSARRKRSSLPQKSSSPPPCRRRCCACCAPSAQAPAANYAS